MISMSEERENVHSTQTRAKRSNMHIVFTRNHSSTLIIEGIYFHSPLLLILLLVRLMVSRYRSAMSYQRFQPDIE